MSQAEAIESFGVPKREWTRRFGSFNVQVAQHFRDVSETQKAFAQSGIPSDDGGYRWNVYAFIFPQHPLFAEFDQKSDSFGQKVCVSLPFHYGPSYLRRHFNENGEVSCYQVGSDYNHLHDERFTRMAEPIDAARVFLDAADLIEALTRAFMEGQRSDKHDS